MEHHLIEVKLNWFDAMRNDLEPEFVADCARLLDETRMTMAQFDIYGRPLPTDEEYEELMKQWYDGYNSYVPMHRLSGVTIQPKKFLSEPITDVGDTLTKDPIAQKCVCNLHQLMRGEGHNDGCCERKGKK